MTAGRLLQSAGSLNGEPGEQLFETARLLCRRFLLDDAEQLAAAADHAQIAESLKDRFPVPYTLAEAQVFLGRHQEQVKTGYPVHVAIFIKPGDAAAKPIHVGSLGCVALDDVNYRTWSIGYWLTPSSWGKGYATEVVMAFVRWAFATWPQLHRIEASVFTRNKASAAVLRKAGFTEEVTKRQSSEKMGVVESETNYAVLRGDATQTIKLKHKAEHNTFVDS